MRAPIPAPVVNWRHQGLGTDGGKQGEWMDAWMDGRKREEWGRGGIRREGENRGKLGE